MQRKRSRACQQLKPGDLFCLIDEWGRNQGSAVLLAVHAPWTISANVADNAGFWHYEVLHDGAKKFVRSGYNTLMPLVNEEE